MTRSSAIIALVALWLVTMGAIVQSTPASASSVSFQYKDKFTVSGYNGNNGTHNFNGAWWEYLDWGGSKKGSVSVESGGECPDDRCARISGKAETFWGTGLMRRADTADAEQVTLRFKYQLDIREPTSGYFNVGVFDGAVWTVVDSFGLSDPNDDQVHSKTYDVTEYADAFFTVGFFAHDDWDAELYIDNVEIFGDWDEPPATTTTLLPTTTTIVLPTTTTVALPPTTTTITLPPTTTTTITLPPTTTTTAPPTTTTQPPGTTSTTRPPATTVPPTTTGAPPTSVVALPPPTTSPPSSTQAPAAAPGPLIDDERYTQKAALIRLALHDELMALPAVEEERVSPSPVTQLMASITTTGVTVRSHLLSAMALGLLIAIAAIWGLGKREPAV